MISMNEYLGIDRALSFYDHAIKEIIGTGADPYALADLLNCLRAAQAWLMSQDVKEEEGESR